MIWDSRNTSSASLSPSEREKIQKELEKKSESSGCFAFVGIFIIGIPLFCLIGGAEDYQKLAYGLITGIIFVPLGIFLIYSANAEEKKLKKDFESGQKTILHAKLADKTESHYEYSASYFLVFGEQKFATDLSTYVKAETGKEYEVHYATGSKFVLEVKLAGEEKNN